MVIPYTQESVRLTGRWARLPDRAVTTAPGAYIECAFEGDMAVLRFDVTRNVPVVPHLWISVDGGDRTEVMLDRYLRIRTSRPGRHTVQVIFKSASEESARWREPLTGAVQFLGVQTDCPTALAPDTRQLMEFIGDSITEGVSIDTNYREGMLPPLECNALTLAYQNDAAATWAFRTAEALDCRPVIMGYGSVGATRGGQGRVPAAPQSYPFCYEGVPLDIPQADLVVINHGANDYAATPERYAEAYTELLDRVRARSPRAAVFAVSAFRGTHRETLAALIPKYNEANGCRVHFIDTAGWIPPEPLHPHRDGHETVAAHLAPVIREILKNEKKDR